MTTDLQKNNGVSTTKPKAGLYFLWVFANGLGSVIGVTITIILIISLFGDIAPSLPNQKTSAENVWKMFMFISVISIPFGSIIGVMQWLVIKKYFKKSGMWFATCALSMFVGNSVSLMVVTIFQNSEVLLTWFIFGGLSGFFQWLIIRKQITNSWVWILVYVIAGVIAAIFGPEFGIFGSSIGWALSGLITGGVLTVLISKTMGNNSE